MGAPGRLEPIRLRYARWVRPHLGGSLRQQRIKLMILGWGYLRLLGPSALGLGERIRLIVRFVAVDWVLERAHQPGEMAASCRLLARRRATPGRDEVIVEAGCWHGAGSVKLSLICRALGYRLHIFDSFAGVEPGHGDEGPHDYTGEYAATADDVRANLAAHGAPDICELHAGWFRDSFAAWDSAANVAGLYIDCDLASGTVEVLAGTAGRLTPDAVVLSQDTQLESVRTVLADPATWQAVGLPVATARHLAWNTAVLEPAGGRWVRTPA